MKQSEFHADAFYMKFMYTTHQILVANVNLALVTACSSTLNPELR